MSTRLNRHRPKLEEYPSARKAPHKKLVSKFSKAFSVSSDDTSKKYESLSSILWKPIVHAIDHQDACIPKTKHSLTNQEQSVKKLVGNSVKEKVKKYEKLPPGFDEERGFLEDYQNMDMNTLLDEDDEEIYGPWKWVVAVLVFFFLLVAYIFRVWAQRNSLDSISN